MNDILTPVRSRHRHEQPLIADLRHLPARVSPLDRLSLRVGLWLLLRTTRRLRPHDEHARIRAAHLAHQARERAAQRAHLLTAPRS